MDQPPLLRSFISALALLAAPCAILASDDTYTLSPVEVRASSPTAANLEAAHNAADGGDWLRQQSGVDGNRMGGHGIDPVIRGLRHNQLNVLLDGAYVFAGCPNRMDPPSAYAALQSYDKITIHKGITTLRHGPGGSGGSIVFEREQPFFMPGPPSLSGQLGGRYNSNGDARRGWLNLLGGDNHSYIRSFAEYSYANNYQDGSGRTLASGYGNLQGGIALGWTPNPDSWLELSYEETRGRDLSYAGAAMDSPRSDNATLGLRGRQLLSSQLTLSGNLALSEVRHRMDNFSLREAPVAMGQPMKMSVSSESDTLSGRLMAEYQRNHNQQLTFGVNGQHNVRHARLLNLSQPDQPLEVAILWPDVAITQVGAFAEIEHNFSASRSLSSGVRLDRAVARPRATEQQPDGPAWTRTPAELYQQAYQAEGDLENRQWLYATFLRGEQQLGHQRLFATLSLSQRMADASELYLARNVSMGNEQWIGNPDLKPETHHQVELGIIREAPRWDYSMVLFANAVTDYIYRDQLSEEGLQRDIYRNIAARLYGMEGEVGVRYGQQWQTRLHANAMRGDNRSDGGSLAQISPYQAQLSQHWNNHHLDASLIIRMAASNSRTNKAANESPTASYAVMDTKLTWLANEQLELTLGADNLLGKTYANFINRNRAANDPFNAGAEAFTDTLTEPGRSLWVSGNYRF